MDVVDLKFVEEAAKLLERPSFMIKVTNLIGRPLVYMAEKLPAKAQSLIQRGVEQALTSALRLAISTMRSDDAPMLTTSGAKVRKWAHTATAMGLGATSGFAGGWALALELPVTTAVIMRSIAGMAQAAGFDPSDPRTALEILTVFAYGSPATRDDEASDTSFFMQRAALDLLVRDGATFITGKTVSQVMTAIEKGAAPRLVELLAKVAVRMNLVAGEKFLAQSLPLLGAAGGAVINGMFNDYYSSIAYYAFGLRRLESVYGEKLVREAYDDAVSRLPAA